jgi:DNA polymerase I-like protein with 3'-5' exonuclease and polymerase domains
MNLALPELGRHSRIRFDCETTGLRWWNDARPCGFSWLLPETGEKGYAAFGHDSGNNCTPEQAREWARHELRGKHITNQRMKFDVHQMRAFGADLVEQGCTFSDVAHNAALLDDNRYVFNLNTLVADFLPGVAGKLASVGGVTFDKSKMARYPGTLVAPYAIRDVELVDLLDVEMLRRIDAEELRAVYDLENAVIPAVCEMEKNGAPIDLDLLDQFEKETFEELKTTLQKIYRSTGVRFECESSTLFGLQKVEPKFPISECRRLFAIRGVPVPIVFEYEDGEIVQKQSFEDEQLAKLNDPIIQLFRYAKQLQSLRSKYIVKFQNVVGSDGLIRYELNQLATDDGDETGAKKGTVSGRFSSSGGPKHDPFGINVQQVFSIDNQKKTLVSKWLIRRLFVPRVGTWFRADAKQIEYRLFAHYADSEQDQRGVLLGEPTQQA